MQHSSKIHTKVHVKGERVASSSHDTIDETIHGFSVEDCNSFAVEMQFLLKSSPFAGTCYDSNVPVGNYERIEKELLHSVKVLCNTLQSINMYADNDDVTMYFNNSKIEYYFSVENYDAAIEKAKELKKRWENTSRPIIHAYLH